MAIHPASTILVAFETMIDVENKIIRPRFGLPPFTQEHVEAIRSKSISPKWPVNEVDFLEWLMIQDDHVDVVQRKADFDTLVNRGDYCITHTTVGTKGFLIRCPKCGCDASSGASHTVISEEPLTVKPSFVCPHKPCTAHYFIEDGKIRWV